MVVFELASIAKVRDVRRKRWLRDGTESVDRNANTNNQRGRNKPQSNDKDKKEIKDHLHGDCGDTKVVKGCCSRFVRWLTVCRDLRFVRLFLRSMREEVTTRDRTSP